MLKKNLTISIVSPVYNSRSCLGALVKKINFYCSKISKKFEIILVDDGSQDDSWNTIKALKKKYHFILGIKHKKNYGQQQAINTGIKFAKNKLIIVMDCDMEDNPKYIEDMYKYYLLTKKNIVIKHQYRNKNQKKNLSKLFSIILAILSNNKEMRVMSNFILFDEITKKKYLLKTKNCGSLYGDLLNTNSSFFYLNKPRAKSRRETTYNFYKLIILAIKIVIKYSFLTKKIKFYENNVSISEIIE